MRRRNSSEKSSRSLEAAFDMVYAFDETEGFRSFIESVSKGARKIR
jgi:hypothetical protein